MWNKTHWINSTHILGQSFIWLRPTSVYGLRMSMWGSKLSIQSPSWIGSVCLGLAWLGLVRHDAVSFSSVWSPPQWYGAVCTICKGLPCLPQKSSSSANVNDVSILSHIINISLVVREQFACTIWSEIENECECEYKVVLRPKSTLTLAISSFGW